MCAEKKKFWRQEQTQIESLVDSDSKDFWKTIGQVGVGEERKKSIPMEIITESGVISNNVPLVLKNGKTV